LRHVADDASCFETLEPFLQLPGKQRALDGISLLTIDTRLVVLHTAPIPHTPRLSLQSGIDILTLRIGQQQKIESWAAQQSIGARWNFLKSTLL